MRAGSPGVGPSPGLYSGTAPRRGDLASCFPAAGCGRLRGGLKPTGLGGLAGRDSGSGRGRQGIAGIARGLTAWGAVRAAFAGQAGLVVRQKGAGGSPNPVNWERDGNFGGRGAAVSGAALWGTFPEARQASRHGGRKGQRWRLAANALTDYLDWPGLQQVCCLERARTERGTTTVATVYAITSLSPEQATPERLLELWRGHWGIANRLHWGRDVTFGEDRCRGRSGAAPQVLAALRNLVSGLLRLVGHCNIAAAWRHYGWQAAAALHSWISPYADN